MIKMVPFYKAVRSVSYSGLKNLDSNGKAIINDITINNPTYEVLNNVLMDHVQKNNFYNALASLPIASLNPQKLLQSMSIETRDKINKCLKELNSKNRIADEQLKLELKENNLAEKLSINKVK